MSENLYDLFLDEWVLDVSLCDFKQGEPPVAASCFIYEAADDLIFDMKWTDDGGETHHLSFQGKPDGISAPFNGGALADSLSITAVSSHELNTAASLNGVVLMSVIRRLSSDGLQMAVLQEVKLPDATVVSNKSVYFRK